MRRHDSHQDLIHVNTDSALSQALKDDVVGIRSEVGELGNRMTQLGLGQFEGTFSFMQNDLEVTITDDNQGKFRQWLDPPDPSENYNRGLKERFPGTGTWFIKSSAFIQWKTTPGSFLWAHGMPGCGKSILSSSIIEAVSDHCSLKPTLAVLYFYFDFTSPEKQQREKMIRSLIFQLSSQYEGTRPALKSLHSSCADGGRQPAHEQLLATLQQMMECLEETYLVVDALDECKERRELLAVIENFTGWKAANLHILATSRKEEDIEESMELCNNSKGKICIESTLVNDDIRAYVHGRLQLDRDLKRWQRQPKVQQEIEDTLADKADGM